MNFYPVNFLNSLNRFNHEDYLGFSKITTIWVSGAKKKKDKFLLFSILTPFLFCFIIVARAASTNAKIKCGTRPLHCISACNR